MREIIYRNKRIEQKDVSAICRHLTKFQISIGSQAEIVTVDPVDEKMKLVDFDNLAKLFWQDRKRLGLGHLREHGVRLALEMCLKLLHKSAKERGLYAGDKAVKVTIDETERMEVV